MNRRQAAVGARALTAKEVTTIAKQIVAALRNTSKQNGEQLIASLEKKYPAFKDRGEQEKVKAVVDKFLEQEKTALNVFMAKLMEKVDLHQQ